MLRAALNDGVGLGEWLVAGPQLMKKLRDSRGPDGCTVCSPISSSRGI